VAHVRLAVQFINLVMLFIYKLQHSTARRSVTGRMCRTGRAVVKRQKSETSFTVIIIELDYWAWPDGLQGRRWNDCFAGWIRKSSGAPRQSNRS